jgi:hypothetical protein
MEISMEVPQKKPKNRLILGPCIPLLKIYQKEYKSMYKRDSCTLMFIVAIFIITKLWNQSRCPKTYEVWGLD